MADESPAKKAAMMLEGIITKLKEAGEGGANLTMEECALLTRWLQEAGLIH